MITATLAPMSYTFNFVTEKPRVRHGSVQLHHFPFSNLNFCNHIDRSAGCFGKCNQRILKTLGGKDGIKVNHHGIDIERFDNAKYSRMLKDCTRRKSVREGKQIHAQIIKYQEDADVILWICLFIMYAKCGNVNDARQVFDRMPERTIMTWDAMLSANIQNGHWDAALKLVGSMHDAAIKPSKFTCSYLLRLCAEMRDPEMGKALHGMTIKAGFEPDEYVKNQLVDMYKKCNLLLDACQVFDNMPERSIASWGAMVSVYLQNGHWEAALKLVGSMHDADIKPSEVTCSNLLGVCAEMRNPKQGKALHGIAIKSGFEPSEYVQNRLVHMYKQCNLLTDACQVFDNMTERNIVSWDAMLSAYVQNGHWEAALKLAGSMHDADIKPSEFTCSNLLVICAKMRDPQLGKALHGMVIKAGFEPNGYVENGLFDMYVKCTLSIDARRVFDKMSEPSIVSWNQMLLAYIRNGCAEAALKLVGSMHDTDIKPDEFTCSILLGVCAGMRNPVQGKALHGMAIKAGFVPYEIMENGLVDMYAKCNLFIDAWQVFDKMPERSIVSWNTMLSAYVQNGYTQSALKLVGSMHDTDMKPDEFTCFSLLGVCTAIRNSAQGKAMHGMAIKAGFVPYDFMENALVYMYAKCNLLIDACSLESFRKPQNLSAQCTGHPVDKMILA